jgi:hypothetical protein
MPDIGDGPGKQQPGFPPVRPVIIGELAHVVRITVHAGIGPPLRVIVNAVRRVGGHQMRLDRSQGGFDIVPGCTVAAQDTVAAEQP